MIFEFTGLKSIYGQAIRAGRKEVIFEVKEGAGRFVFMIFFSSEDLDSRDRLYLLLRRTRAILPGLKMVGSRFQTYFSHADLELIREELDLQGRSKDPFTWEEFFATVNALIPASISTSDKVKLCREVVVEFPKELNSKVDEAEKIHLIGTMRLPQGKKPRDKTLRKLFFYAHHEPYQIEAMIDALKEVNLTLCWSAEKPVQEADFQAIVQQAREMKKR